MRPIKYFLVLLALGACAAPSAAVDTSAGSFSAASSIARGDSSGNAVWMHRQVGPGAAEISLKDGSDSLTYAVSTAEAGKALEIRILDNGVQVDRAVISTDADGAPALLVAPKNAEMFAAGISDLLSDASPSMPELAELGTEEGVRTDARTDYVCGRVRSFRLSLAFWCGSASNRLLSTATVGVLAGATLAVLKPKKFVAGIAIIGASGLWSLVADAITSHNYRARACQGIHDTQFVYQYMTAVEANYTREDVAACMMLGAS